MFYSLEKKLIFFFTNIVFSRNIDILMFLVFSSIFKSILLNWLISINTYILSEKYKKDPPNKYHIIIDLVKAFTTHPPSMGPKL